MSSCVSVEMVRPRFTTIMELWYSPGLSRCFASFFFCSYLWFSAKMKCNTVDPRTTKTHVHSEYHTKLKIDKRNRKKDMVEINGRILFVACCGRYDCFLAKQHLEASSLLFTSQ